MGNKKILIEALKNLNKAKKPVKKKDIIYDKEGQWKYPGQPTRIPSNEITMKGVSFPVLGKGSDGSEQMMYPGMEYTFPGADYVDEYPQMKKGGTKKFSSNLQATNRLFKKNSLFKKSPLSKANPLLKKKNYKGKTYDPSGMYFQDGGVPYNYNPFASIEPEVEETPMPFNPIRTENDPEDYNQFLEYSKTAPENRRPYSFYGDPNEYDHYGMWEALGKPKNFEEALQINPDWEPDPYDGYYHGFSVNPNTGVFLKSGKPEFKEGDTTWMEIAGHYQGRDAQKYTPVFDPEIQRFKYIPNEKDGGYLELELTPEEIEEYKKGGYVIEEVTDPSIPTLNTMQKGGPLAGNPDIPVPPEELCEEGFAWDQEKNICVPLPDMKEWFSNWYSNRTLPLDEIDNKKYVEFMKQKLPKYNPESTLLQRISNLPDLQYVDMIDDDPNVMGQVTFDKKWNPAGIEVKESLRGNAKELGATWAHEGSTYLDLPDSDVQFPAQNLVIDPGLVMFKDRWGDLKGTEKEGAAIAYDYQTDPQQDNIHSLVFEERFKRDLKPDQVITEQDIESWKTEAEASGALDRNSKNFDHTLYTLLKLSKDNKALANWFNQLASNDRPVDETAPQYAMQGGSLGYQLGDEIDEATMQKLKKQGYTFEKIK